MKSERWVRLTRAVHAKTRALGLDDAARRDIMERATGKRSCSELGTIGLSAVLTELDRLRSPDALPDTATSRKLRALWISGYHLGVVHDRTDRALSAFVRAQTGLSAARWAHDPRDARKAVDRLKAWLRRAAGVQWRIDPERFGLDAAAVLEAQCRILGEPAPAGIHTLTTAALNLLIAERGERVRRMREAEQATA